MSVDVDQTIEIRDSAGRLCGTYHYQDPFKSFFRGLYTPSGVNVVACPPPEHPHHKGLQFGLTCKDVNFWEESLAAEPADCQLPIGVQQTTELLRLAPADGNGFLQEILWRRDQTVTFQEKRIVVVKETPKAYVWTWQTTLIAKREVTIISSVWGDAGNCGRSPGYCGLGLRLVRDAFQNGQVVPPGTRSGSTPARVSYVGKFLGRGVEVTFEQAATQGNALFLSFYGGNPDFAFMALGPTNLHPLTLKPGQSLECRYVVTVADF
jgi:Methane oxygenase PmoA